MDQAEALDRLRKSIRLKHLAYSTEETYCHWLVQFCRLLNTVPASLTSEQKIEKFLTGLALKNYSASSQNQAFCAILFFYRYCLCQKLVNINALRAKRGQRIRNAPSREEVKLLLANIKDAGDYPVKLIVSLIYGCGLRVTEPLNLRIRDVLLNEGKLIIRAAKGDKDRILSIPCSLTHKLEIQMRVAKTVWGRDLINKVPLKLPDRIAQKYPDARFSYRWAWLFPSLSPCIDPRSNQTVRWRMLECNIQRAIKQVCNKLNLDIQPHSLRHGYATHLLNNGVNPRSIQLAMGHTSLDTTINYLHGDVLNIKSPLDNLINI